MADLTTDEVRDAWVNEQLRDIPLDRAVRLVRGLQIFFDGWLGRERQKARNEVLDGLRARVEELQRTAGVDFDGPWTALQEVLVLIEEVSHD